MKTITVKELQMLTKDLYNRINSVLGSFVLGTSILYYGIIIGDFVYYTDGERFVETSFMKYGINREANKTCDKIINILFNNMLEIDFIGTSITLDNSVFLDKYNIIKGYLDMDNDEFELFVKLNN